MRLVHSDTREPVQMGEKLKTFRGKKCELVGWQIPLHGGSTGRILIRESDGNDGSYFPGVCGLEWEGL